MFRRGGWFISSAGAQIVTAVAGLGTNVLYVRFLAMSDVGIIALANSIAIIMGVFVDRGAGTWLTKTLPSQEASTWPFIMAALRMALIPGCAVFSVVVCGHLFSPSPTWARAVALSLPLIVSFWFFQIAISAFQGLGWSSRRGVAISLNGVLTLAGTWVALAIDPSVFWAIIASSLAYIAVGAGGFSLIRRRYSDRVSSLSATSVPLRETRSYFATNLVVFGVSAGDAILLGLMVSPESVGIYQIARKIAQGVTLPIIAVGPVLLGKLARLSTLARRRLFRRTWFASYALLALGSAGLAILYPLVLQPLLGSGASVPASFVLFLVGCFGIQMGKDLSSAFLVAAGAYRVPLWSNVGVILTIVFLLVLSWFPLDIWSFSVLLMLAFSVGSIANLFVLYSRKMIRSVDLISMMGASLTAVGFVVIYSMVT